MFVVLGCFWSLHFESSSCSGVTELELSWSWSLLPLFVWKSSFIGCSLVPSLPTAFTEVFGVIWALLQKRSLCFHAFLSFTCEMLGAQRCIPSAFIKLKLYHWFSFAVLAHTWLFSIGVVDLELLQVHLLWCTWCSSAPGLWGYSCKFPIPGLGFC